MLVLPYVFQQAGYMFPLIVFGVLTVISTLACQCMCEAMSRIPGNSRFQKRVEFSTVFKYWFGNRAESLAQLMLCLCITASNCASIIALVRSVCISDLGLTLMAQAQVMDEVAIAVLGQTWALQIGASDLGGPFSVVGSPHGANCPAPTQN